MRQKVIHAGLEIDQKNAAEYLAKAIIEKKS